MPLKTGPCARFLLGSFKDMKFEIMTFFENFGFWFYLRTNSLKYPRCYQISTKCKPFEQNTPFCSNV